MPSRTQFTVTFFHNNKVAKEIHGSALDVYERARAWEAQGMGTVRVVRSGERRPVLMDDLWAVAEREARQRDRDTYG